MVSIQLQIGQSVCPCWVRKVAIVLANLGQSGQIAFNDIKDDRVLRVAVIVDQAVPHALHSWPRDGRKC